MKTTKKMILTVIAFSIFGNFAIAHEKKPTDVCYINTKVEIMTRTELGDVFDMRDYVTVSFHRLTTTLSLLQKENGKYIEQILAEESVEENQYGGNAMRLKSEVEKKMQKTMEKFVAAGICGKPNQSKGKLNKQY